MLKKSGSVKIASKHVGRSAFLLVQQSTSWTLNCAFRRVR